MLSPPSHSRPAQLKATLNHKIIEHKANTITTDRYITTVEHCERPYRSKHQEDILMPVSNTQSKKVIFRTPVDHLATRKKKERLSGKTSIRSKHLVIVYESSDLSFGPVQFSTPVFQLPSKTLPSQLVEVSGQLQHTRQPDNPSIVDRTLTTHRSGSNIPLNEVTNTVARTLSTSKHIGISSSGRREQHGNTVVSVDSHNDSFPITPQDILTSYEHTPIPFQLHKTKRVGRIIQSVYDKLPPGDLRNRLGKLVRREKNRVRQEAWRGRFISSIEYGAIEIDDTPRYHMESWNQHPPVKPTQEESSLVQGLVGISCAPNEVEISPRDREVSTMERNNAKQGSGILNGSGKGEMTLGDGETFNNILLIKEEHGSMLAKLRKKAVRKIYSRLLEDKQTDSATARIFSLNIEAAANRHFPTMDSASKYIALIKAFLAEVKVDGWLT